MDITIAEYLQCAVNDVWKRLEDYQTRMDVTNKFANYRVFTLYKNRRNMYKEFNFNEISAEGANNLPAYGPVVRFISVAGHYLVHHSIQLLHPKNQCLVHLVNGQKYYYPIELVALVPHQPSRRWGRSLPRTMKTYRSLYPKHFRNRKQHREYMFAVRHGRRHRLLSFWQYEVLGSLVKSFVSPGPRKTILGKRSYLLNIVEQQENLSWNLVEEALSIKDEGDGHATDSPSSPVAADDNVGGSKDSSMSPVVSDDSGGLNQAVDIHTISDSFEGFKLKFSFSINILFPIIVLSIFIIVLIFQYWNIFIYIVLCLHFLWFLAGLTFSGEPDLLKWLDEVDGTCARDGYEDSPSITVDTDADALLDVGILLVDDAAADGDAEMLVEVSDA
jgi:hypothetical protein